MRSARTPSDRAVRSIGSSAEADRASATQSSPRGDSSGASSSGQSVRNALDAAASAHTVLEYVRERLHTAYEAHAVTGCEASPRFTCAYDALHMLCDACTVQYNVL